MYSSISLYYFSGSGNTYRAAQWLAETVRESGAAVETYPIPAAPPQPGTLQQGHLVGILGPTHAFTAPWSVIRFCLSLPRSRGAHAFTLFTRGGTKLGSHVAPGLEGTAGYLTALILLLKGYRLRGVMGLDMPSNWTILHPAMPGPAVTMLFERARPRVAAFITRLLSGQTAFFGIISLLLGLVLLPVSLGYMLMGRFFLAKIFYATGKCTACGRCVRDCPVNGVTMRNNHPYWTLLCESCMRCFNYCPNQAVEASYPFAVLVYYAANIPVAAFLLDRLARAGVNAAGLHSPVMEWLLDYPYKLAAIVVAYLFFHALMRVPVVNRLLTFLTPTHYYRRYHSPGYSGKDR